MADRAVIEPEPGQRRAGRPPKVSVSQPLQPVRTLRLPGDAADLASVQLLPAPTAQQVAGARAAAGHTQRQAATLIGASRWQTWSGYEGGHAQMPALAWTWYLLASGQHAELQLAVRRRTLEGPRQGVGATYTRPYAA